MSRSAHDLLGLEPGASPADLQRAYRKALARIEADTSLTDAQRSMQADRLDAAFRELSAPAARRALPAMVSPTLIAAMLGIAIAGGGLYWYWTVEQERQAAERERIAAEQKEAARLKELAERAERERQRVLEEIRAQKEAEEAAHRADIVQRQLEMKDKRFVEDDRPELKAPARAAYGADYYSQQQAWQAERARQVQEYRQRAEAEAEAQRAREETERQKRYLERLQREEEIARIQRERAARSAQR
jgi:hypothetical protein